MTDDAQLGDARWLRHGEVARLLAVLGSRRRRGARRRRRGAQCAAYASRSTRSTSRRRPCRKTSCAASRRPAGKRFRPASTTAPLPSLSTASRSRLRRCGRTSRPTAARPRSCSAGIGAPTPSGAISPSMRCRLSADGTDLRLCRRHRRYRRAPRAFHRRAGRRGSPKIICVSCAFSAFTPGTAKGHPDAAGLHACILARAGLDTLSRERVRMELLKLLFAPHATPTLAVMAEAGILGAVLGGVPLLASFENVVKAEAAMGCRAPTPCAAWARSPSAVREDGERLGAAASLVKRGSRAARCAGALVARLAGSRRAGRPCASLSSRPAILRRSRARRLVALGGGCGRPRLARAGQSAAAMDGAEISAEGGRFH